MEQDFLTKDQINYEKLLNYGFQKNATNYFFSQNILNNQFQVNITIDFKGKLSYQVMDLQFGEEYILVKIPEQNGAFVNKIRHEVENIFNDIKEKCLTFSYFVGDQANRLADLIIAKYDDYPEFLWENSPEFGVFRNQKNQKWYGLFARITKNKIDVSDEQVDILNIKLNPEKIKTLLTRENFYPAYHMNKKNWITIILDNTISDEEIMDYINESYLLSLARS